MYTVPYQGSGLDIYYQRNIRRTFPFDGIAVPWANDMTISRPVKALADLPGAYLEPECGSISPEDAQSVYDINSFSGYAADAWQVTPKLNVNPGLRYDSNVVFHEVTNKSIPAFLPWATNGFAIAGKNTSSLYPGNRNRFDSRSGFAHSPVREFRGITRQVAYTRPQPNLAGTPKFYSPACQSCYIFTNTSRGPCLTLLGPRLTLPQINPYL